MEIVYCFIGKLPSYIVEAVFQTRLFFPGKITLITDDIQSPYLQKTAEYGLCVAPSQDYQSTTFQTTLQTNFEKFCIAPHLGDRKLLFIRAFERFFYLENYMKAASLTDVLFLELDVLIYKNPIDLLSIFRQKEITLSYVRKGAVCSGYCYIRDSTILSELNSFFLQFIQNASGRGNDSINEMAALEEWLHQSNHKERVWMLPGIWKDTKWPDDTWNQFDHFQGALFDGAGIAIRLDGPDHSHRAEWERRGKVWWGTDVQYDNYEYEWRDDTNGNRILHLLNSQKEAFPVYCLHVHNKNLGIFLSKQLDLVIESHPPPHTYIHGNRFLHLADVVLRTKMRNDYYEVEHWNPSKCFFFEDIPLEWKNPSLLYCHTDDLHYFIPLLSRIQNKFVLITHNSDENITSKYLSLILCPNLVHWYTQNLCIELPKTSFLPIGIANPTWPHGNPSFFEIIQKSHIEKKFRIYANFRISTNPTIRKACADILQQKGIPLTPESTPLQNLFLVASSFFTVCPEGNGKDTHRFWEALLCKTIPIVIRSHMTEQLRRFGYPCVLLDSWNDLQLDSLQYDPSLFTAELEQKLGFAYYQQQIHASVQSIVLPKA